jgi:glycosyltransferase involved in cell wall biosynthesis
VLLRAFAQLRATEQLWNDYQLVIVGAEGPETQALLNLTRELGLMKNVRYLSTVSESELAWLYRNCLVVVIPSSHEGLCMPLIEAVSSGARVVCADIPVLHELELQSCTYCKCQNGSIQALSEGMAKAVLAQRPKESPRNPCSPGRAAQELLKIYQAVMASCSLASRQSEVC